MASLNTPSYLLNSINVLKSILNTLNRRTGRTVRATRNDARAIELRTDTTVERCARERHRTRIGHRVRTKWRI